MSHSSNSDEEAKLFHEGIALFNAGDWFDAHEIWEDVWHMASGRRKSFYQGLIQCAVTLEHVRRGNPRGVRSVWQTCVTKFAGIDGDYMGIDVPRLLGELGAFIQPILDLPPSSFDPALPRGQDLPIDWQRAPRIELKYDPFTQPDG